MKYKALSVRQPWAHAITWAGKTLEVRSRQIKYRGDVLICSSQAKPQNYEKEDLAEIEAATGHKLEYGKALCLATITDCKMLTVDDLPDAFMDGIYDPVDMGNYGWRLENIRPIVPFPVKGQLNLFSVVHDEVQLIDGVQHRVIKETLKGEPIYWAGYDDIMCVGCMFNMLDMETPEPRDVIVDVECRRKFIKDAKDYRHYPEYLHCKIFRPEDQTKPKEVFYGRQPCDYYLNPWGLEDEYNKTENNKQE